MGERRPIVLFGGSGFVGIHARRALAAKDAAVIVVSRRPLEGFPNERIVKGDLTAPQALCDALPRGSAIVNLAYDPHGGRDVNLAMAEGLVTICRQADVRSVVHVSTAVVVGLVGERRVDERTTCRPRTLYQRVKLDVEARLTTGLAGVCPLVVLRPTSVFGAGGFNLRKLALDLATRSAVSNYLRACLFARRPMNLVPVETVAAAVLFAALNTPKADATTWLVADDEAGTNNFADVEHMVRTALGMPPRAVPVVRLPIGALAVGLRVAGRLSFDPRTRFRSDAITAAGFVRPVAFADALAAYTRGIGDEMVTGQ